MPIFHGRPCACAGGVAHTPLGNFPSLLDTRAVRKAA